MVTATAPRAAIEAAQRGDEIYERDIRPQLPPDSEGKVVAIDVHTGAYEIAENVLVSGLRLRARLPQAEIWFVRVGQPAVHRLPRRALVNER